MPVLKPNQGKTGNGVSVLYRSKRHRIFYADTYIFQGVYLKSGANGSETQKQATDFTDFTQILVAINHTLLVCN
jgi:hypothetical protein